MQSSNRDVVTGSGTAMILLVEFDSHAIQIHCSYGEVMAAMLAIASLSEMLGLQLLINAIMLLGYHEASYTKSLKLLYIVYFFWFCEKVDTSKDRPAGGGGGSSPLPIAGV